MIEEFSFGNFRSFKDIQSLNMTAAKIKSHNPEIDEKNLIRMDDNLSLLKSKAIYGANASGKSNVVMAFEAFCEIIRFSARYGEVLSLSQKFRLSTETHESPTYYQIIIRINNIRYRYGFEATSYTIISEWLFSTPAIREQTLFLREDSRIIEINKRRFPEGYKLNSLFQEEGSTIFRHDSLFLPSVASFGFGKLSKTIVDQISAINTLGRRDRKKMHYQATDMMRFPKSYRFLVDLLKHSDIGIDELRIASSDFPNDLSNNVRKEENDFSVLFFLKEIYDKFNNIDGKEVFFFDLMESHGTKKMFELTPILYDSLINKHPLIIDELDASLHPLLTKKIIELFNSPDNTGAQLIFVTHDTNLLSSALLRRDQIDFVEKDKYGASHLYSLVDFKGIRSNASFEKDYIQGKYGAIPYLGDFSQLLSPEIDA